MNIAQRSLQFMAGFLKSYGPSNVKKILWDKEFAGGKWNFIDNTLGDPVYTHLVRHLRRGSILDLGCGPGNTANELPAAAYKSYIGVDISEVALAKAKRRTEASARAHKNRFIKEDFLKYTPSQKFDVILFRESMYHVPLGKVKAVLDRYADYLKEGGAFVVRTYGSTTKYRPRTMLSIIEREFDVIEKSESGDPLITVLAFRPKRPS